ncbi:alanine racemase [Actinacidiphila oryziradicis]|uniref:Amino acid deaminase n=1 Tax=Actinacidiphila oryziradicis TaxID=2571141 RepID=A0A4U0SGA9_9ACTN|nr:alanine racemase [Actinacidiphila oryziradicis]TKA08640.1 amino acid deaminase [Actinacidiphila oryziradicis]
MEQTIDARRVAALADERLDWRFKAVPAAAHGLTAAEFLAGNPHLDELGTPLLTLDAAALDHNLRTMAAWCAAAGVGLAPHGKTTMAPALWQRQLEAGAEAITLANLSQVRVARAFGVRRIHVANALLDPAGLRWIAGELDADPGLSLTSWADSVRTVELMSAALATAPGSRPLDVCVELGSPGGRTGARTPDEALATARAVHAAPRLRLAGVSGYEGALAHDTAPESIAAVERYLRVLVVLHDRLREEGLLTGEAVLTAGGSAYFDTVVRVLAPAATGGTRVLLRSGAYLVHDDGFYRSVSPLAGAATPFRSAMHGWARVVSRPEPALALLDCGKRDFPYDEGLPQPQSVPGRITALNDQHAFLRDADAAVGDVVRLGLSHPCTAFDKWTLIPVLDDADADRPNVVDLVRTFF